MARFCPLFTGSNGNSAYVGGSDSAVLIDAGRSCKQILAAMDARGIDPGTIRAVLITHEHHDHVSGLRVLLKRLKAPLFATEEVLERLRWDGVLAPDQEAYTVEDGKRISVGALEIDAFDTPHDSAHSVCYRVNTPDGRRLAIATDMGYITERVEQMLTGCDLVMIESNYDRNMLSVSDYPYYLKQRIASDIGHLSNEDCAEILPKLVRSGSTRFILGHLSEHNNTPDVAYQTAFSTFLLNGMKAGVDFSLKVASRSGPTEMVIL